MRDETKDYHLRGFVKINVAQLSSRILSGDLSDSLGRPVTGMSINEGLGTTMNIRVMEHCDWINLERKNYDVGKQNEIEMISH